MIADEFVFGLKIFTSSFLLISMMPAENNLNLRKSLESSGTTLLMLFPLILANPRRKTK